VDPPKRGKESIFTYATSSVQLGKGGLQHLPQKRYGSFRHSLLKRGRGNVHRHVKMRGFRRQLRRGLWRTPPPKRHQR